MTRTGEATHFGRREQSIFVAITPMVSSILKTYVAAQHTVVSEGNDAAALAQVRARRAQRAGRQALVRVGEADDLERVVLPQAAEHLLHRVAGQLERLALHAARRVDDEDQLEGRSYNFV